MIHLSIIPYLCRELKNSMIDIEEFMDILRTKSSLKDGSQTLPQIAPSLTLKTENVNTSLNHSSGSNGSSSSTMNGDHAIIPLAAADLSGKAGGLEIQLRDVHFGYSDSRKILRGITIRVEPGQSVAIVGPSGSGKSTILRLLTRQYDVTEGSVLLNGVDLRDLAMESLRAAVAVVPQVTGRGVTFRIEGSGGRKPYRNMIL